MTEKKTSSKRARRCRHIRYYAPEHGVAATSALATVWQEIGAESGGGSASMVDSCSAW